MKVSILVLAIVLLLLLAGAVLQSNVPAAAQSGEPAAAQGGLPADGNYRLAGIAGEPVFLSSGGGYRLRWGSTVAPAVWPDQGAGCCCTYLPCTLHQFP